jgi:hypothetical protein
MAGRAACLVCMAVTAFGRKTKHGYSTFDLPASAVIAAKTLFDKRGANQFFKIFSTTCAMIFIDRHIHLFL